MAARARVAIGGLPSRAVFERAGGATACFGGFDALHQGHRELIEGTVRRARELGTRSCAIVFRPRPVDVVSLAPPTPYLVPLDQTVDLIRAAGVDHVGVLRFTPELAAVRAGDFVARLCDRVAMRELVVGEDTTVGRGNEGALGAVRARCAELGVGFHVLEGVRTKADRAADLLAGGRVKELADELGRLHRLPAYVGTGERRPGGVMRHGVVTPQLIAAPADGDYAVRVVPSAFGGVEVPAGVEPGRAALRVRTRHRPALELRIELIAPAGSGWGDTFASIELLDAFTTSAPDLLCWARSVASGEPEPARARRGTSRARTAGPGARAR